MINYSNSENGVLLIQSPRLEHFKSFKTWSQINIRRILEMNNLKSVMIK